MEENNSQQINSNSDSEATIQEQQINNLAIIGFILSFLGEATISFAGLIVCIYGIKKAKKTNSGLGLAIASVVIAIIKIILICLGFIVFLYIAFYLIVAGSSVDVTSDYILSLIF